MTSITLKSFNNADSSAEVIWHQINSKIIMNDK
jgi:hypothetical protein